MDPEAGVEFQRHDTRAAWHCGYMDRDEWTGAKPDVPPVFKWDQDVCPGYLIDQPLIGEIVVAHRSFDKGNWDSFYPNAPNVLCEGVEWFSSCIDSHQARLIREASDKKR